MVAIAVSETARLIASLELQDKFSRTAATADRALGGLERRTGTLGRVTGELGRGLNTAGHNLAVGAVAIGIGLGTIAGRSIQLGIRSLRELEDVTVATNAVIESTGGIAGISADRVRDLAEKYEDLNATMDDKVIQSAENLLLTFTKVGEDAFEPALEAALNLNEVMGGGEEGLQNTIIKVGRALNDPIRNLGALTRAGVIFTDEQRDQIRALVEANDLYGAQQIILGELGVEFGGQFAAAGETATGKFAKLQDAIEDAQMALATAFLPVLVKVADKLSTFLSDPATIARIEDFGATLAGGLEGAIEFAGKIPWGTIGTSLQIAGAGAKILLDAFVSLPPWVQTAVITGWGLNKLTGGALGNIVGTLASGLIKGVLGINAGVVNVNAASVTGLGGAPVGGAGGAAARGGGARGLIGGAAKFVLGPLGAAIIGAEIAAAINESTIRPALEFEEQEFTAVLDSKDTDKLVAGLAILETTFRDADLGETAALLGSHLPFIGDALGHIGPKLDEQKAQLIAQLEAQGFTRDEITAMVDAQIAHRGQDAVFDGRIATSVEKALVSDNLLLDEARHNRAELGAKTQVVSDRVQAMRDTMAEKLSTLDAGVRSGLTGMDGKLAGILAKETSFTANITIPLSTYVNASLVAEQVRQQQISVGFGSGHGGPIPIP